MLKLFWQNVKGVFKIKKFELAIIGAGPVGLFAANYAHLHNLKTIIFDSLNKLGGQAEMLYPYKIIKDIPAYQEIKAQVLISKLTRNLARQVTICPNHRVNKIAKEKHNFIIDDQYVVKSIIVATGNGAFKPKKIPLTMSTLAAKRVHYFIKNPQDFSKQQIGIFGGGDSALDMALEESKFCQKITLIHRRPNFRGLESSVNQLKSLRNVEILTPYLPKAISLTDNQLKVELKQVGRQQTLSKNFDQIIVAYGFRANNNFVKKWGIELKNDHIKVDTAMKTNLPGIYAVGDAVTYAGRVPIIGVGFGEAQIAINSIMKDLFPQKTLTIHSTSL